MIMVGAQYHDLEMERAGFLHQVTLLWHFTIIKIPVKYA